MWSTNRAKTGSGSILVSEGFDGTGGYLKGKQAGDANALATTLDEYNNGNLCTP